jgi:hypothetical protein
MTLTKRGVGLLGRLTAVAAAAVAVAAGVAVSPAQAYGSCGAYSYSKWLGTHSSLHLVRTTSCTYYARFVEDHDDNTNIITLKVERREGGAITERKQIDIYGPWGSYNTGAVQGWWSGAASQDQHNACYAVGFSNSWTCTGWVDV